MATKVLWNKGMATQGPWKKGMAAEGPLAPAPAWLPGCRRAFPDSLALACLAASLAFGSVSVFGAVLKTIRIPLSLLRRFSRTVDSGKRPSSKYFSFLYLYQYICGAPGPPYNHYYSVAGYRRSPFKALLRGRILRIASFQEPNAVAFWLKTRRTNNGLGV